MNFMLQKQWALTKTNIVYHEGQIMELEQHGLGVWCVPSILCDGWVKATTVSRQFLFFTHEAAWKSM